jgi:hypothetical protein
MDNTLIPEGRYLRIDLPDLNIVAHWVLADDDGKYIAIRAQCGELGINTESQMAKFASDSDLYPEEAIREFRIETAGGRQVTKCLRKAEAAIWLATIKPSRVRKDLRDIFEDVRKRLLMAADRIVWGDMTDVRAVAVVSPKGGELHLGGCPGCRRQLMGHFGPEGITLYLAEGA